MTITEITEKVASGAQTPQAKILLLKRIRANLLEELHGRQQLLDQVDYLIYELRQSSL